jgi:hypothetical protein
VYRIPRKPNEDNGIIYLATETRATDTINIKVIDDLNIKKKTLAERRIVLLSHPEIKLFDFPVACFFISDLVKASRHREYHWIDSVGKVFKYAKTSSYKLVFKRITKVMKQPTYTLLEVEGLSHRIKTLFPPPTPSHVYAGILVKGLETVFYGYSETSTESNRLRRSI